MKKLFYIHSNIVAICCYQTVKHALASNDEVIIITDRSYIWTHFIEKVRIYDFGEIFKGEDRRRVSLMGPKVFNGYFRYQHYLCHLNKVVKRIVSGNDFILYLPTMALETTAALAYNKHCKGYYYVEEGSLSNNPNIKINNGSSSKLKDKIKRLLRIEDHFPFEINSPFKGTISITEKAFPWNTNSIRIINSMDEFASEINYSLPFCDAVIVTAWLVEDIHLIIKSIDYCLKEIFSKNQESRIGIKFHPKACYYNSAKTSKVLQFIRDNYNQRVTIIPNEVSIEVMSYVFHPRLYSLFALSSLILYGILLKSSEGYLIDYDESGAVSIVPIMTMEDFFRIGDVINYKAIK